MRRTPAFRIATAGVAAVGALTVAGCSSSSPTKAESPSPTPPPSASTASPASPASSSSPGSAAESLQQAYVGVVKAVLPSVAQIRTGSGLGSGVVFDAQGDIVTNAHVVGSATQFQVTLPNTSKPLSARLVGTYTPDDLAVIKVEGASNLHHATFGDSSKLAVGDIVLAMGSPLGLSGSVTNGIVSALGRTVTEPQTPDSPGATLPNVIQTSAAINPGNSGGALVDLDGQVVGIPTLAAVDPSQGALSGGAAPGIGFAIPSATVKNIAGQLVKSGKVTNSHRAALGVSITGVISTSGDPAGCGIVSVTSGGAAEKAGLRAGDIITAVNGTPTPDPASLAQALAQLKPGQKVAVTAERAGGSAKKYSVTLGELPG